MINYTSIETVIPLLPRGIRRQLDKTEILAHIVDGYNELELPGETEPIAQLFEVKKHMVKLPSEVKTINLVTHLANQPTEAEEEEFVECIVATESTTPDCENCVGNYILAHKTFITSDYYNNNYYPMKYIGNMSKICDACFNRFCHDCSETFSIDHNKTMWTSFKEGFVCVDYDRLICDEEGYIKIIDDPNIKRYLAYFVEYQYWRNRSIEADQAAYRHQKEAQSNMNVYYNKARGSTLSKQVNRHLLAEVGMHGVNERFFRMLPDNYRVKTELGSYNQYESY